MRWFERIRSGTEVRAKRTERSRLPGLVFAWPLSGNLDGIVVGRLDSVYGVRLVACPTLPHRASTSRMCALGRPPSVAAAMEWTALSALAILGGQRIDALVTEGCELRRVRVHAASHPARCTPTCVTSVAISIKATRENTLHQQNVAWHGHTLQEHC